MKTIKLIAICTLLLGAPAVHAQVSTNLSKGTPPMWGPTGHSEVRYYYLPALECYYDVHTDYFIYHEKSSWVYRKSLPHRYQNYDLYGGYKVVLTDYIGDSPYHDHSIYIKKYPKSYRGNSQKNIGKKPARGNSKSSHGKNNKKKKAGHHHK